MPDRLVLMPNGKMLFAEIKAPGKKPRPLQAAMNDQLRWLGFTVCVIDSKDTAQAYANILAAVGGDRNAVHPT